MRAFITSSLAIATLGFSCQVHSQSVAVTDGARAGTFKQVQGETWVGSAADRRPAVSGEGVQASQRISTGKTGAATLTLKDGTVLTMGPNSTMDLSAFEFNATTQEGNLLLDLLQGSVRVVTGLLGKANPEKFKVKTPTSVVGVRGTDFIVETEALN
ncbi:MAG: FecR domain-containing protein [Hydrogenophaga sp.]